VTGLLREQGPDTVQSMEDVWELAARTTYVSVDPRKSAVRSRVMETVQSSADRAVAPLKPKRPALRLVVPSFSRFSAVAACLVILVASAFLLSPRIQTFHVPAGMTASQFTLPDGSTVSLSAGSRLSYSEEFGKEVRPVRLHGRAFFDVEKSSVPFEVHTFDAVTTVLGTSFGVEAWPGEMEPASEVVVATGRVAVAARNGETVLVPGEKTVVQREDGTVSAPATTDVQRSLSWRSGGFMYDNEPIGNVLEDLERRYDVKLDAPASIRLRRISYWKQQAPTAAEVVGDIAATVGVRYRAVKGGYELFLQ